MTSGVPGAAPTEIRPMRDAEVPVLGWLWQLFRADLATITDAFPYGDGRYQAQALDGLPSPDRVAYLAWRPHPKTGEQAPVGFALVDGLGGERRSMLGFWVVPRLRRAGVGRRLALDALGRHPAPWLIGFQHENPAAGAFWRSIADEAFGAVSWSERRAAVPGRPDVPADHILEAVR